MDDEPKLLTVIADGVATLTFNRPEKLNALTPAMLEDFFAIIAQWGADPDVRVIVITGAGRGFSAGLDLGAISAAASEGGSNLSADRTAAARTNNAPQPHWGDDVGPALGHDFTRGWNGLITCRKPTIAAINGPAFGWGFILALHCDIRFAARSAVFNATFARLGVPAEKGMGWLLPRLIGIARAADLLYTARRVDAAEAERIGLVNEVVEDDRLMTHVDVYARAIAANAAPRALAAMKAQIWTAADNGYDAAFAAADLEQGRCTQTEDFKEGVGSYLAKRPPVFTGR